MVSFTILAGCSLPITLKHLTVPNVSGPILTEIEKAISFADINGDAVLEKDKSYVFKVSRAKKGGPTFVTIQPREDTVAHLNAHIPFLATGKPDLDNTTTNLSFNHPINIQYQKVARFSISKNITLSKGRPKGYVDIPKSIETFIFGRRIEPSDPIYENSQYQLLAFSRINSASIQLKDNHVITLPQGNISLERDSKVVLNNIVFPPNVKSSRVDQLQLEGTGRMILSLGGPSHFDDGQIHFNADAGLINLGLYLQKIGDEISWTALNSRTDPSNQVLLHNGALAKLQPGSPNVETEIAATDMKLAVNRLTGSYNINTHEHTLDASVNLQSTNISLKDVIPSGWIKASNHEPILANVEFHDGPGHQNIDLVMASELNMDSLSFAQQDKSGTLEVDLENVKLSPTHVSNWQGLALSLEGASFDLDKVSWSSGNDSFTFEEDKTDTYHRSHMLLTQPSEPIMFYVGRHDGTKTISQKLKFSLDIPEAKLVKNTSELLTFRNIMGDISADFKNDLKLDGGFSFKSQLPKDRLPEELKNKVDLADMDISFSSVNLNTNGGFLKVYFDNISLNLSQRFINAMINNSLPVVYPINNDTSLGDISFCQKDIKTIDGSQVTNIRPVTVGFPGENKIEFDDNPSLLVKAIGEYEHGCAIRLSLGKTCIQKCNSNSGPKNWEIIAKKIGVNAKIKVNFPTNTTLANAAIWLDPDITIKLGTADISHNVEAIDRKTKMLFGAVENNPDVRNLLQSIINLSLIFKNNALKGPHPIFKNGAPDAAQLIKINKVSFKPGGNNKLELSLAASFER